MADFERPSPDEPHGGMPDIPPEVVEAFKNLRPNLEAAYAEAKHSRATIVQWLEVEAERRRLTAEQKRGFMLGALAMMGLYDFDKKYAEEIAPLEALFLETPYTDEKHTEPPKIA